MTESPPHLLIVEARFYTDLADALVAGAAGALEASGATFDRIEVPGALEIPGAIAQAIAAGERGMIARPYDGFVALGVVIRGETSHYDTVCNESARGIMDLTIHKLAAIGNGILTVENREQAWTRADRDRKDKGGGAALAALSLVDHKRRWRS